MQWAFLLRKAGFYFMLRRMRNPLACLVLVFGLCLAQSSFAATSAETWTFKLANGTPVKLVLNGVPVDCQSEPLDSQKIFTISTPNFSTVSSLCMDDTKRPDHLMGFLQDPTDASTFYLSRNKEYTDLMADFATFGTPNTLPLGSAVNGKCPAEASAFVTVFDNILGDEAVYGYCLIKQ
jgi:hypothetical protein